MKIILGSSKKKFLKGLLQSFLGDNRLSNIAFLKLTWDKKIITPLSIQELRFFFSSSSSIPSATQNLHGKKIKAISNIKSNHIK